MTPPSTARIGVALLLVFGWLGGCTKDIVSPPPTAAKVQVSPDTLTTMTGQTAQLTATVSDASGRVLSGRVVIWTSQRSDVATVSTSGLVTGVALGRDTITATVDGVSGRAAVTVLTPTPAKVTVSPDSSGMPSNGTLQLTATLDDGNGHTLPGAPVTWATRNPAVATVSRAGLVTAVAAGRDTITATNGGKTGVGVLDVGGLPPPPPMGILVSDLAPKPTPPAAVASLRPRAAGLARLTSGSDSVTYVAIPPGTVPGGVTAQVFNPASASLVTAAMTDGGLDPVPVGAKDGDTVTIVTTTAGGVTAATRVPVTTTTPPIVIRSEPPARKTDVPLNGVMAFVFSEPVDPQTISAQTVQLVKDGQLVSGVPVLQQGGLRVDFIPDAALDPQATYTLVVTTAVRSLKGQPLRQADVSSFTTATFAGAVNYVFVTPPSAGIEVGGAIQLTATPADTFRNPVRAGPVTWSSDNPGIATVSATGLVTGVALGQTTIRASLDAGRVTGSATVVVVPLASLIIDGLWDWTERIVGTSVTCNDTGSYSFTQVGVNFAGQSQQVGSCRSPGDNALVAPVKSGLINGSSVAFTVGGAAGYCSYAAQVTGPPVATLNGPVSCSDGSTGTWSAVRQEPIASVTVIPAAVNLLPNATTQLVAAVSAVQGNRLFFRPAAWSSDKPGVATVSASGLVTAVAPGSATVTASSSGKSGSAAVSVLVPIASVTVTPSTDTIAPGASVQFTAVPRDAAGNPLTGRVVTWSNTNPTAASLAGAGLAIGGPLGGVTTIMASSEGVTGRARLTVSTGVAGNVAGEWTFVEQFTAYDDLGNPFLLCNDAGSFVLNQTGFTFDGSAGQAGNCATEAPRRIADGVVSDQSVSFFAGVCQYYVTLKTAPDSLNGGASCTDGSTVSIQAVRAAPAASITVTPAAATILGGTTLQLTALVRDAAGNVLYTHPVTWTSDNGAVAGVTSSGVVSGASVGTATITATANPVSASSAITVTPPVQFTSVRGGYWSTCGLTAAGTAYCWGFNGSGELGDAWVPSSPWPLGVSGGISFASVAAHFLHSCGLTSAGSAYCWGANGSGQLGDGVGGNSSVPQAVSGGLVFTMLTGGEYHTCGLTAAGAAYCWGANDYGQLGNGTMSSSSVPVAVAGSLTFTTIDAGANQTCGLTAGGQAYCWGANYLGSLGDGTLVNRNVPVAVVGGLSFTSINAEYATCALTAAGEAYCWGYDGYGQLGDGSNANSSVPVKVAGGLMFTSLTGGDHTCGLTPSGTAYCWGANSVGELGDGSTMSRSTPVPVVGGLVFASLWSKGTQTCGITTGGVAYCWGDNQYGQLGDGTITNRSVPVKVGGQP
jgi:uncharacterized protein YjdB